MDKIDKFYYINLEHRKDRKVHIERELRKIDPEMKKIQRINAVKDKHGGLGCTKSHIKTLEDAISNNYETIIIFEDDFTFSPGIKHKVFDKMVDKIFSLDPDFKICSLTAFYGESYTKVTNNISKVLSIGSTAGYMVSSKAYTELLRIYHKSIDMFNKGHVYPSWAIDGLWNEMAGEHNKFYIFTPYLGYQKENYSDIDKCVTKRNHE